MRARIIYVKFFSNCLTRMICTCSLEFVNFFAVPENRRVFNAFPVLKRPLKGTETETERSLQAAPFMENRLARKLLPATNVMHECLCLVGSMNPEPMPWPRQLAETPRGAQRPRGFLFFDFLREIFHRNMGTPSRPLRGGKEGSACRAM